MCATTNRIKSFSLFLYLFFFFENKLREWWVGVLQGLRIEEISMTRLSRPGYPFFPEFFYSRYIASNREILLFNSRSVSNVFGVDTPEA